MFATKIDMRIHAECPAYAAVLYTPQGDDNVEVDRSVVITGDNITVFYKRQPYLMIETVDNDGHAQQLHAGLAVTLAAAWIGGVVSDASGFQKMGFDFTRRANSLHITVLD